ncbi:MAG: molybdopterin-dependent oxidoreductase, partial [Treponema sp.]|nr:molybdopterin-dependent oxidoreductase [Treponema sp.]
LFKLENYAEKCVIKVNEEAQTEEAAENRYFHRLTYKSGDSENITPASGRIVGGSYHTGAVEHWYSEPNVAAADYSDGKLIVHTATQWPFQIKRSLSKMLAISDSSIEIVQTEPGIHLDGKLIFSSLLACQAGLASFITGKPVKIKMSRAEDFRYSPKRCASGTRITSVLGDNGDVLKTEIHVSVDAGSQDIFAREMLNQTCIGSAGMYRLGQIELDGTALKTGKPPQGPMDGFGASQGFFVSERHVSRIADSLRQDPALWRKQNCLTKNDSLAIGIPLKDGIPVPALIDSAAAMSDYYRKWASYELLKFNRKTNWEISEHETKRGIGIAAACQGSGFLYPGNDRGFYQIEMTLAKDSSLEIKTSIFVNDECGKIWRTLAKSILGVEEDQVTVVNSGACPDSGPSCLSRNITAVTRLVERCFQAIRKQRFRDPLPITIKRSVKPGKFIPWEGTNGPQTADPFAYSHPAWGAAVAEIEIDSISLEPKVRGIWLAAEGGKILSQSGARRSLKIAAINALSWTIREQVNYRDGIIPFDEIKNYTLPAPEEIPPIYIDFLWNDNVSPKGIGELPYSCIPAAYVQAVSQAMDHPFEKIPLTVDDIWDVIKARNTEAQL